ncbi:hypothetical protein OG21DRAFT_1511251 [Imleria badia]|nr:hypothetical protein OG21DRAFT_1511251 [Imleria badia]
MKRAFVPTALHAEFTEYTSLVRVLRTARTLDLTAHLIQHAHTDKQGDTWTLWPLIDCPVPEWSIQDEIHQLAARDDDAVVLHTTAVLVHILNLLADQRPSAPGSMQNRLWAMNWEDVISLLAVSGVLDNNIVARAEKRLERIYGPSSTKAMERRTAATSAKARCALLDALAEDQLFVPPVPSRTHWTDGKGRWSHKRGVESSAVVETDTDTDAKQTY